MDADEIGETGNENEPASMISLERQKTELNDHMIETRLNDLKRKIEELKDKEVKRVIAIYVAKDFNDKNTSLLRSILITLIGKSEADKTMLTFIKERQNYEMKIENNKTFQITDQHFKKAMDKNKSSIVNEVIRTFYQSQTGSSSKNHLATSTPVTPNTRTRPEIAGNNDKNQLKSVRNTGNNNNINNNNYNQLKDPILRPMYYQPFNPPQIEQINFNYNPIFNYAPDLQNSSENSTYFLNNKRPSTNGPLIGRRSSLSGVSVFKGQLDAKSVKSIGGGQTIASTTVNSVKTSPRPTIVHKKVAFDV